MVSAQSSCPNLETYDAAIANDGLSSPLASREKDVFGGGEKIGGENRGIEEGDSGQNEPEEKLTNHVANDNTAISNSQCKCPVPHGNIACVACGLSPTVALHVLIPTLT